VNPLSFLYARGAVWRRAWYARHPEARRTLARPVISVGNVSVGGSGKTPVVAALARWLLAEGERPSVLSRGYARARVVDGVVVVSDGERVLEGVTRSGDEPQMLARALPGVPVLAGADRLVAGRIAERRFGCTVHLLDDGFQHFALHRDVDLVLVSGDDVRDEVLPGGRLREPVEAAASADAILVTGGQADRDAVAARLGASLTFDVTAAFGAPRLVEPFGALLPRMAGMRALAIAGIARPQRFFDAVRAQGWEVAKELAFRDHHWFSGSDLKRMLATARAVNADVILTTEKDAVRLLALPLAPIPRTFAYLPMTVAVEPAHEFRAWLHHRLAAARSRDDAATISRTA
jgi:tetraacyldisaccharide 4'-kinase